MADWLVAETDWHMEQIACEGISRRGFTCYQPRCRERRVVRGRKMWVERFLLGRYLLVELVAAWCDQLSFISGQRGVARVLKSEERPLLARAHEVERLRSTEIRGFVSMKPRPAPKVGERGYMVGGPFYGFRALYDGQDEHGDLRLLVDVFGRLTLLTTEPETWEPA